MADTNGLLYLRARYYSPALGVFPSLDPVENGNRYQYVGGNPTNDAVGELMAMNRYAYANGNPVNLADPSGMIAEHPGNWDECVRRQDKQSCEDCCLPLLGFPYFQYWACVAACELGERSMCLGDQEAFRLGDGEARYEPEKWSDLRFVATNNCYNYATNQRNCTVAIPGLASGVDPTSAGYNCRAFEAALVADGLVPTTAQQLCAENCYPVVLLLDPGEDFHFYRKDDNGRWSSKVGGQDATDQDWSGNVITDSDLASGRIASGPYTEFCGYFCVCEGQVKEVKGRLPGPCRE